MHASEVWYGSSPQARVARAVLTPLSWLYAGGWATYASLYRVGLKHAHHARGPVIVVGNLPVGGSGKTPATISVYLTLRALGHEVVIGCSGYGSPRSQAASLAPEGELNAAEWGDEPAMIRWLVPDAPLVVGRDRVLASAIVDARFGDAILLMDDGYQHLPLAKDVSILLEPPEPTNTRCLPAGPYREPRSGLGRADLVIGTEFRLVRQALVLVSPQKQPCSFPPQATALCALARPDSFIAELGQHCSLVNPLILGDHDPLTSGTLLARLPADLPVIVTAKDWVKLRSRQDVSTREFLIAIQDAAIEPADRFEPWLKARLNESQKQ